MNSVTEANVLHDNGLSISESGVELKLRKLNTGDIFNAARMIKRLDIKEDLKSLISEFSAKESENRTVIPVENEAQDQKLAERSSLEIGIDFIFSLLEIFADENTENEFYKFLAGPFGVSSEQVKELEFELLAEALMKIADVDRWKYFLSRVVRSR